MPPTPPRISRISRISRQSITQTVSTLEHDGIAIALQEALGARVLLIRVIGEGGMGRVYLGRDPQLKRFVAVKVLVQAGADVEAHARFQREAQAIAAVSHPNVVSIYGVGELPDGTPYFVMQYVSGGSMSEKLAASGPLEIGMAESVIGDVAAALAAAHKRGIVHRDVKPANVLWDDEAERATVSDFGIASLMSDDEGDIRITQGGMTLGSPAYMSPEQLVAEPITPKSDIYTLGLLGYELLTGRGPYTAENPAAIASAHLHDAPRRLSDVRSDVPPVLEALLLRCLAKNAEERPTADEVMAALTPGAADLLEWPPPGLERARGALWRLMAMPTIGAICLLFPLVLMLQIGRMRMLDSGVAWAIMLGVASLLGFAAFIGTLSHAWRTASVFDSAARLGYGWGTIAEVMADRRGDTGALIAGSREYATLGARQRSAFRLLRVVRAMMMLLGAPVALVVAFSALSAYGSQADRVDTFVDLVWWTVAIFALGGIIAGIPETLRLAAIRRKRGETSRRKTDSELAPAWYAAFERSREGQSLGAGWPVPRFVAALAGAVIAVAVFFCSALLFSIMFIVFEGQAINSVAIPSITNWLVVSSQRNWGAQSYRTPPDGVTSAADAGEAMAAILATGGKRARTSIERVPSGDYPRWMRVVPPSTMFVHGAGEAWTDAAILAAANGLTAEQRALLTRAAAHPAREEFDRLARAREVDLYGALIRTPVKETPHPSEYPLEKFYGLDEAMESRAARVALDVADHRVAEAERGARDMVAVGSLVVDMPFSGSVQKGYHLLQRGVRTLESVYIASGRERDARILMDSIAAGAARINRFPLAISEERLHDMIRSSRYPRGIRMELINSILARACADPRQLMFGPDDVTKRDVAYVRDSLARYPSERIWIESLSQMIEGTTPPPAAVDRDAGTLAMIPAMIDRTIGGHRFVNCVIYSPVYNSLR